MLDADTVAAPPTDAAPAATEERARFRLHVPRALLVTLLGIALSAWLVPAMTRQWDDRQKERELKAGVVSEMALASARALVGGERVWSGKNSVAPTPREIEKDWELSTLGLEARLGAYFPRSVVTDWEVYAWAVDRFINADSPSSSAALQDAVHNPPLDTGVADATAYMLALLPIKPQHAPSFGESKTTPISDRQNIRLLHKMLSPELGRYEQSPTPYATWTGFEKQLLDVEQAVADQVLRSHAAGFSTTAHDLMRDLLP